MNGRGIHYRKMAFFLCLVFVFILCSGCGTNDKLWPDNPMGLSVKTVEYSTDSKGRTCFVLRCCAKPGKQGPFEKEGQPGRLYLYPLLSAYDGDEWVEYNGLLFSSIPALDENGNGYIFLYQEGQSFPIPTRFAPEEGVEYRLKLSILIRYSSAGQKGAHPADPDVYSVGEYPVEVLTNGELYAMGDS